MSFYRLNSILKLGIFGGIIGGTIAIVGFWILSPQIDSLVSFVVLRMIVGAVVAMIVGPILLPKSTRYFK